MTATVFDGRLGFNDRSVDCQRVKISKQNPRIFGSVSEIQRHHLTWLAGELDTWFVEFTNRSIADYTDRFRR